MLDIRLTWGKAQNPRHAWVSGFCAPRGIRSQILSSPSLRKFCDPARRPASLQVPRLRLSNPSRLLQTATTPEHALGLADLCAERDSNPRRPKPPRLQRGVIDRSTIDASCDAPVLCTNFLSCASPTYTVTCARARPRGRSALLRTSKVKTPSFTSTATEPPSRTPRATIILASGVRILV